MGCKHFPQVGARGFGLLMAAMALLGLFMVAGCDLLFRPPVLADESVPMVAVPGGSFQMGTTGGGPSGGEDPLHTVKLSGFRMSKYEVTQAQYAEIMGNNPSYFTDGTEAPARPVEGMTWYDAVDFCNRLSQREGYQLVYTITDRTPETGYPITSATVSIDMTRNGYRLPTEAEWEYAARGGDASPGGYTYSGSNDINAVAWWGYHFGGNSGNTTHPVGMKAGNGLGLYDLTGNVWEWCQDWYGAYGWVTYINPVGASSGEYRVLRGGGWGNGAGDCRSAFRGSTYPDSRRDALGFRLARRP